MEESNEELEQPREPFINFTKTTLTPNTQDIIALTIVNSFAEKLQLTIRLPNHQTITKEIEQGEHYVEIPVEPLNPGTYTMTYQLTLNGEPLKQENVELTVAQPKRFRS